MTRRARSWTAAAAIAAVVVGCAGGDDGRPTVDAAEWTEHWDCGFSFQASNTEGTERLVIRPVPGGGSASPTTGTVELPSPDWSVRVELGEHFGARGFTEENACTDVIDGSAPEERIDEAWEVVEGTLTIGPPEEIVEWPGTARVAAEGLVAVTPDGERVGLRDISTRSDCWGCFPG